MKRLDTYWCSINFFSLILIPFSALFCLISFLRKQCYTLKLFKSYTSSVPVIVVGNITVGGTGKTPLIIELVRQLQALGKMPGVISRGYGGNTQDFPKRVDETTCASEVGDEPQLIFKRLKCPVVVGPNRQADIELIMSEFNCDVILSDDGLQHYALNRDVEIVVIDYVRKFGNGLCLPAGPLRERSSRLKSVDLTLYNGTNEGCSFLMRAGNCMSLDNDKSDMNITDFQGKTIHAVAGIGHPQRFFDMLKDAGINVIPHAFPDHYDYQKNDLLFDDSLPVLMTEKDAIKCNEFGFNNHWSVPIDIQLSALAQQSLNAILSREIL